MSKLDDVIVDAMLYPENARQAIKDLMLELIGEDEPDNGTTEAIEQFRRNQFRSELRKKVSEL